MSIEPRRKGRRRKVTITPEMWENFFRNFEAPLFLEDVSEVLEALQEVRARGITDIGSWLDAHPEFMTRLVARVHIIDANDHAVRWAGARDKKDLASALGRMVLPETLPAIKALLVDLYLGKSSHRSESEYISLDGRHIYSWNQALLPRAGDDPPLLMMACTDITGLKLTQKKLLDSQERYARLVEAAQDVILSHDLSGRIIFVNQAGTELSGWHQDEILNRDVGFLLPEIGEGGSRRQKLETLGKIRGRTLYETHLLTRDNRRIPVEVNSTVVPGLDGKEGQPLLLAMIRDISDRQEAEMRQRELESQLKNTQRMESLGILAGGIAHDFNNLLVTIMGNTELLLSGKYSPEEVRNTLRLVLEASTQAADLCRQMQAYAGQTVAEVASEDLNSIVDNMSRLLQVTVAGRAQIGFQLQQDLPQVLVDAGQIRQVLMNLVNNAAESLGDDGGQIVLRTGSREFSAADLRQGLHPSLLHPGSYVYCEVSDSGAGMTTETVQRMFDPFFTTKASKRGLGMSMALGIIQSHQGGFLVHSQPGKGSTVSFLLPERREGAGSKPELRRKKEPDNLHLNLTGKTVMAVDEDAAVRTVGEGFLRRLGCKVLSAGNGRDAVRIFGDRHQEIDAVLLDLTMEGMDGVETCRRLRVIRPDLPVVFSSGYSPEEVRQRASEVGEFRFVAKPFRLAQIRAIMAEAMGGEPPD